MNELSIFGLGIAIGAMVVKWTMMFLGQDWILAFVVQLGGLAIAFGSLLLEAH